MTVDGRMVSAMVMQDAGSMTQRALGLAADCVVDVEISDVNSLGGAAGGHRGGEPDAAEDRRLVDPSARCRTAVRHAAGGDGTLFAQPSPRIDTGSATIAR